MKWKGCCRFSLLSLLVATVATCVMLAPNVSPRRENRIVLISDTSRDYLISTKSDRGWPFLAHSEKIITENETDPGWEQKAQDAISS